MKKLIILFLFSLTANNGFALTQCPVGNAAKTIAEKIKQVCPPTILTCDDSGKYKNCYYDCNKNVPFMYTYAKGMSEVAASESAIDKNDFNTVSPNSAYPECNYPIPNDKKGYVDIKFNH